MDGRLALVRQCFLYHVLTGQEGETQVEGGGIVSGKAAIGFLPMGVHFDGSLYILWLRGSKGMYVVVHALLRAKDGAMFRTERMPE